MSEQLEGRLGALRTRIHSLGPQVANHLCETDSSTFLFSKQLAKLKDMNRHLQLELDALRVQLADAESDSKLLREELRRVRKRDSHGPEVMVGASGATLIGRKGSQDRPAIESALVGKDRSIDSSGSERISDHIVNEPTPDSSWSNDARPPADQVAKLVEQLEHSKQKVKLLEKDLEAVLDEKEELVTSRNEYKLVVERLSQQIKHLKGNSLSK